MTKGKYDLAYILESGGSVEVDATRFGKYDLAYLAEAAKRGGGMLIVKNASKFGKYDLAYIAESGKGHVIFRDL